MPVILVNENLCDRCNTCARGCILGILEPAAGGAVPRTKPGMDAYCLKCGHCEALCPRQALGLPEDRMVACAMLYGVPRRRPTCVPRRNPLDLTWR